MKAPLVERGARVAEYRPWLKPMAKKRSPLKRQVPFIHFGRRADSQSQLCTARNVCHVDRASQGSNRGVYFPLIRLDRSLMLQNIGTEKERKEGDIHSLKAFSFQ